MQYFDNVSDGLRGVNHLEDGKLDSNSVFSIKALYFLLYCQPKFIAKKTAQKIADFIIQTIPRIDSISELKMYNEIFSLCIKKGASLKLPLLKVKTSRRQAHIKEGLWFEQLNKKEVFNNVKTYNFILQNEQVNVKDKALLESILLQSLMSDLILLNYNKKSNGYFSQYLSQRSAKCSSLGAQYNPLYEVELMIDRGYIFHNQISTFLSLSSICGYREIFDCISNKSRLLCYQAFDKLNIVGKKALTALLVKNRNDDALFNLIRHGIKLDWEISVEADQKNILGFELLYDQKWIKAIIDHPHMDIRITNVNGENILHLVGGTALEDETICQSLRRKINQLSHLQKTQLFFQINECGMTPLMKAVVDQDETMIMFIEEFNIKPWEEIPGSPYFKNAMDLLNNHILQYKEDSEKGRLIEYYKNTFWLTLKKKWDSQFYYTKLQQELNMSPIKKKGIKI